MIPNQLDDPGDDPNDTVGDHAGNEPTAFEEFPEQPETIVGFRHGGQEWCVFWG